MNNQHNDHSFNYTYSAANHEEIIRIRDKYTTTDVDKLELLRKLDSSVTQKGNFTSFTIGIIGALIMGTGMSCTMVWQGNLFIPGIIIGIVGIILMSLAYPIYNHITKKERKRVAPEIIKLADELLK